jgi:hypothetical protein
MQVDESIAGREHVVPSIVQVGFLLLEVLDGDRTGEAGLGEGVMNTEEIGINMLKSLFEIHEMARTKVCSKALCPCFNEFDHIYQSGHLYDLGVFQFSLLGSDN